MLCENTYEPQTLDVEIVHSKLDTLRAKMRYLGPPGDGRRCETRFEFDAQAPAKGRHPGAACMLMITVEGESLDFVVTDPTGHVAVLAVDSARCEIPGCELTTYRDMEALDHDDSDTTSTDSAEAPARYGGGNIMLIDPVPGVWSIEAHASRSCREFSCQAEVVVADIGEGNLGVNEAYRGFLRTGESIAFRMILAQRPARVTKNWVRLRPESARGNVRRVSP
jgi:hypothetical protein